MSFDSFHAFIDTNALVKVVYAVTLHRRLARPKPRILGYLETRKLVFYTDEAVLRELSHVALPKLLSSVDREKHGWSNVDINLMREYCISELSYMINSRYVRVVEDEESLKRRGMREVAVCFRGDVMDRVVGGISEEDIDIVNSLLYAYDIIATALRGRAGMIKGTLLFITDDKDLRNAVENSLACEACACGGKIVAVSYVEFKQKLRQLITSGQ
ncbi:hypothetical protein [Pyrobaculum ferrireducens]|uniref:PIN domain-containing protein n=1 Tax=Pyrobaculum ferrireducens TaxID=1104324 RepID=G7VBJ5_9CREN|nr:hypothetical protein [Pyrobaculum ferrireducens]AET32425.1 hypothetical protein P186_0986 [Pyrobaculum ferrireducens]